MNWNIVKNFDVIEEILNIFVFFIIDKDLEELKWLYENRFEKIKYEVEVIVVNIMVEVERVLVFVKSLYEN